MERLNLLQKYALPVQFWPGLGAEGAALGRGGDDAGVCNELLFLYTL